MIQQYGQYLLTSPDRYGFYTQPNSKVTLQKSRVVKTDKRKSDLRENEK